MELLIPKAYEEEQKMGGEKEIVFLTATDILSELHKKNVSNIKMSSVNVGKSLKILGFEQHSKYRDDIGISIKGYYLKFKNDLEAQETEKENNQPEKQPAGKQNDLPF
jgi:hypothetical protein